MRRLLLLVALALLAAAARADARGVHVQLNVTKAGTGVGRVTSTPPYIDCGEVCASLVPSLSELGGGTITLTATPAAGSVFTGWAGACAGAAPTCSVEIDDSTTVTAIFDTPGELSTVPLAVGRTGSGTVVSEPAGIACGAVCAAAYAPGTAVTLTASPALGWTFAGWSGACTGTAACSVTVDAPTSVTARFQQETQGSFALAVGMTGNGAVTSAPAGIDCPSACAAAFPAGTAVTLTATPAPGASFDGWSGACSGTGACTVTLDGPTALSADFGAAPPATFPVAVTRTGTGAVRSTPAGIDCPDKCSLAVAAGTSVTLEAVPQQGWVFAGWSGACTGTAACTLVLDGPKALNAAFTQAPLFPLAVTRSGRGTVASSPAGIDCGERCSAVFRGGTTVTLYAVAAAGYVFAGWTGDCAGNGATCPILMNDVRSVSALFRPNSDKTAPSVRALPSSGRRGAVARLRYRVSDASSRARQTIVVRRGARSLATLETGLLVLDQTRPGRSVPWRVPRRVKPGTMTFCVRATDAAGNRSASSCAPLRIR